MSFLPGNAMMELPNQTEKEKRRNSMPIPDKIAAAEQKYAEKLKEVRFLAAAEPLDPDFEKKTIDVLLKMLELKTEADILGRVLAHRSS